MAYRKLRIVPTQSDPLTEAQNLLDFRIPANLKVEADKSYVSVFCKVSTSDVNQAAADGTGTAASQQFSGGKGVYNVGVVVNTGSAGNQNYPAVKSVSLVKNAHLISANKGNVEHLRDVNKLRLALESLENTFQVEDDQAHVQLGRLDDKAWGCISPLIMTGAASYGQFATYVEKEIRIPLKDIFNICSNNNLDTGYLGALDMHLEMDMSRVVFSSLYNTNNNAFVGANGFGVCDDDATAGDKNSLTLTKAYDFMTHTEECPFYLGQKIQITAGTIQIAAAPGGPQDLSNYERIITGISHVNNKVILGLDQTLGTAQAAGILGVRIRPLAPPDTAPNITTLSFNRSELVLRVNDSADNESGYEYTTYTLEKDQGGGATSFSKQYECEPESINLMITTPLHAGGILSNLRQNSQRISINNKETTNRDVHRHTPLYNAMLNRYSLNSNIEVKNLAQTKNKINYASATPASHDNPNTEMAIYEPLPQTPQLKLVNVEMNMDAARTLNEINLFKEVVRTI